MVILPIVAFLFLPFRQNSFQLMLQRYKKMVFADFVDIFDAG